MSSNDVDHLRMQFDKTKSRYWEMETAYKTQIEQLKSRREIPDTKAELQKIRAACVEMTKARESLLDRIAELERNQSPVTDKSLKSSLGTDKESRLRARVASVLNDQLNVDLDPYTTSRHCGPAAMQAYNQRSTHRLLTFDQSALIKAEPDRQDRPVHKLPKRSRPSKASQVPLAPGPNIDGLPGPVLSSITHAVVTEGAPTATRLEPYSDSGNNPSLVSKSGMRIRVKPITTPHASGLAAEASPLDERRNNNLAQQDMTESVDGEQGQTA